MSIYSQAQFGVGKLYSPSFVSSFRIFSDEMYGKATILRSEVIHIMIQVNHFFKVASSIMINTC